MLGRFCHYCAAIKKALLQFYVFPNISRKHTSIYTKFCTVVSGYVYEVGTKNQLNMSITFEVIIILSHI